MKHRLLSLLVVLSLLLTVAAPLQVLAADQEWTALPGAGQYNPLYHDGDEIPEAPAGQSQVRAAWNGTYVSAKEAAAQLRDAMVARQEMVELHVYIPDYWYHTAQDNWFFKELLPMAYSQELAVGLTDGDYLRWSWRSVNQEGTTNGTEFNLVVYLSYYTTYSQEQQFLSQLDDTMKSLDLDTYADLDKYTAIYDYVTDHVVYDYDGLEAWEDQYYALGWQDVDRSYFEIYTAYAALCKERAVCQGYATLVYAMCRWAELPVRVISSPSHSFNIVYLKDIWYYVDSTYDSETNTGRDWFLLGTDAFEKGIHAPEAEYRTAAFRAKYPISRYDYDPATPFNDLEPDSWYYASVGTMVEKGLMNGTGNSRFEPEGSVNRAMVATVLYRMEGEPRVSGGSSFSDVAAGAYYQKAVAWAQKNKIVEGYEDGTFRPDTPVTREQLATMLYRYARYKGYDVSQGSLSQFPDRASVSDYAEAPMAWAVGKGLINGIEDGSTTTLSPGSGAQRAQLATILDRFLTRVA